MMILDPTSLVKTVDHINEAVFMGIRIDPQEGLDAARWIASRQGQKGSYRSMFAPTPLDFEQGIRVFTGERLLSASARHIMGQEAARAAWTLGKDDPVVREAYIKATDWMRDHAEFITHGTFCCGKCTLAYWRHIQAGDFTNQEATLTRGLAAMKSRRIGDGRWARIPFDYAIYTLIDLDLEPARSELKYARPVMERYVKRSHPGLFTERKKALFIRALEKVS